MQFSKLKFGIKDLPFILVLLKSFGFLGILLKIRVIQQLIGGQDVFITGFLSRLVSHIIIPPIPGTSFVYLILAYFAFRVLFHCGKSLEYTWGYRVFSLYIFLNLIVSSLIPFPAIDFISITIFLAFAFTYPKEEFLMMLFIPMKSKTIGIISLVFLLINFGRSPLGWIVLVTGLSNFLIFLIAGYFPSIYKRKVRSRMKNFLKVNKEVVNDFLHECYFCGITDKDDASLEFRVSSEDHQEYCIHHLNQTNR